MEVDEPEANKYFFSQEKCTYTPQALCGNPIFSVKVSLNLLQLSLTRYSRGTTHQHG